MTADGISPFAPGSDAFELAVGAALVAGALSLVVPFLGALVGALAALAGASWAIAEFGPERRAPPRWRSWGPALGSVAAGAIVFLADPSPLAPYRGLALAVSLVPLWITERRTSVRRTGGDGTG